MRGPRQIRPADLPGGYGLQHTCRPYNFVALITLDPVPEWPCPKTARTELETVVERFHAVDRCDQVVADLADPDAGPAAEDFGKLDGPGGAA
jgi:hypothetical protein